MEVSTLISLVTIIVTWLLGIVSKKYTKLNNKLIPIQNILVGLIVALIEWIVTKDFKVAIALSGIFAGGAYDVINNINKMIREQ